MSQGRHMLHESNDPEHRSCKQASIDNLLVACASITWDRTFRHREALDPAAVVLDNLTTSTTG